MMDRFNQMSGQAEMIAQKKAEIEAKLKANREGYQGSVDVYNKLVTTSTLPISAVANKSPSNFANRWGLKGKPGLGGASHPLNAASSSRSATPKQEKANVINSFSNDGSFLEQWKTKMSQQSSKPSTSVPPHPSESQQQSDWYQSALSRARSLATSLTKSEEKSPKLEPGEKTKSEYGGSGNGDVKHLSTKPMPETPVKCERVSTSAGELKKVENAEEYSDEDLSHVVLSTVAEELASMVAVSGEEVEMIARMHNADEDQLAFLFDVDSKAYKRYRQKVVSLRRGMTEMESNLRKLEGKNGDGTSDPLEAKGQRKRKRRWGEESDKVDLSAPSILTAGSVAGDRRSNPQLVQYAIRVFGTTDLTDSQWKQCEDQIKMSFVYNEMLQKKQKREKMEQQGKRQYEYDSDEDTEGGTWEHKARKLEMEVTKSKADDVTGSGKGKHHIGDFLPPEELTKFMNKYKALQSGEAFDNSDYQEHKLKEDNLGFKMLERMGWSEGKGLGTEGQGITAPIGKSKPSSDNKGLGVSNTCELAEEDDEFEAYRKRMMLAYRFRPNPLNNPRRSYY